MFKEMRRKNKQVSKERAEEILNNGEYGVLATISQNGYPYTIPLSYVYYDNCIYFHSAKEGEKLNNILNNDKVSFCVVGETAVIPNKFSTNYESIVAFGRAREINGDDKYFALKMLIEKYSKDFISEGIAYIERAKDKTTVIRISIEHITGKESNR